MPSINTQSNCFQSAGYLFNFCVFMLVETFPGMKTFLICIYLTKEQQIFWQLLVFDWFFQLKEYVREFRRNFQYLLITLISFSDLRYKNVSLILSTSFCYNWPNLNEFVADQISPILTYTIKISLRWQISGLRIFLNTNLMVWFLLILSRSLKLKILVA